MIIQIAIPRPNKISTSLPGTHKGTVQSGALLSPSSRHRETAPRNLGLLAMTSDDENSIYVGGLPYDCAEDELRRVFELYGVVVAVKPIRGRAVKVNEVKSRTAAGRLNHGREGFRRGDRDMARDMRRDRDNDYDNRRDQFRDHTRERVHESAKIIP
ncbi:hypothetical protein AKJ16_DCAP22119 [Drosera capensis]